MTGAGFAAPVVVRMILLSDAAVFPEISGPGIGQPVKDLRPVAVWTVTMEALKTVCAKMIEQGLI